MSSQQGYRCGDGGAYNNYFLFFVWGGGGGEGVLTIILVEYSPKHDSN